jgi:hypothetical protein
MITALCIEVAAEQGVGPVELLQAKRQEREARSAYAQAVNNERAALRAAEERGAIQDCPTCIPCAIGNQVLLCGRHSAQLRAIRVATARRITAQRQLADAQYAVERARRGLR